MSQTLTIIGQGYVGLPLAQAAVHAGWKVTGFDLSERVVSGLNSGKSHIDDLSDDEISEMLAAGYSATSDSGVIAESSIVVICVPTPLGEAGAPDLSFIESASATVGQNMAPGTTVILESTTYPGTTEDVCLPLLEEKSGLKHSADFELAYSPERVDPGSAKYGIKNTPKLVGGITPQGTENAASFYETFVDTVVRMSGPKEAETAKLLENTFRHVNIALVNEMAKVCHEMGIDIWEVLRGAATKPFGFMKFTPGAGVGGHCIPIDPNYLSYEVRRSLGYPLRFVELAQEINNSMPTYVASRVAEELNLAKKSLNGSRVLLLGVTYKKNIADQRESPAKPLAVELMSRGATVEFHDPYVEQWKVQGEVLDRVPDLDEAIRASDFVVVLQAHDAYALEPIEQNASAMLDTTGSVSNPEKRI